MEVRLDTQFVPLEIDLSFWDLLPWKWGNRCDIKHHTSVARMKWRIASDVLCDKNITPNLKISFFFDKVNLY